MCLAEWASFAKRIGKSSDDNVIDDEELIDFDIDNSDVNGVRSNRRELGRVIRFNNYKLPDGTLNAAFLWEKVLLFVPFRCEFSHFKATHLQLYNGNKVNMERLNE